MELTLADSRGSRSFRNRSDLLIRLVSRCETAAAMRPPIPALRHRRGPRLLQLLLVALVAATSIAPSWAALGPGKGGPGAVDNRAHRFPRSATLPLRGPQQRRVGFPRAPAGVPAGNGDVRVGPGSPADLALAGNGDVRVGPEGPAGLALAGEGDAPAGEGRPLGEGGSQAAAHSPEVPLADAG